MFADLSPSQTTSFCLLADQRYVTLHALAERDTRQNAVLQKSLNIVGEKLQASINDVMGTSRDGIQLNLSAALDSAKAEIAASQAECFQNVHARLDSHEAQTYTLDAKVSKLTASHEAMQTALDALSSEFRVLKAAPPPTTTIINESEFRREVLPNILRARVAEPAPLAVVQEYLSIFGEEAGIDRAAFKVTGSPFGKAFTVTFAGGGMLGHRNAAKFHASQKSPEGIWRPLSVVLPGPGAAGPQGHQEARLYLDFDKNAEQVLLERSTKILKKLCTEHAIDKEFIGRRSDYTIFHAWVPVAKIISLGPRKVQIRWNSASAVARSLDQPAIQLAISAALADPASAVQWV